MKSVRSSDIWKKKNIYKRVKVSNILKYLRGIDDK